MAILVAPLVAERFRAPGLIGLLLAGTALGPNGVGLVERSGVVESLGVVGLLYLMFVSGLDLDLDGFQEDRRDSVIFGTLTFAFPGVALLVVALAFGLTPAAALIVAAAFTSHTLLTFPLAQRFGIVRNRAITATLGGTLLATIAALLVLAVAAAAGAGDTSVAFWFLFPIGLVLFVAATLLGLPRLTRWVFRGVGQDRAVRLVFILAAMLVVSAVADLVRIESIVGAFLAGLAVNRYVGEGTLVRERLEVLGSTLFIPLFLISTGMLVDPVAVASDPPTLAMGGAFAVVTIATKWLAVWPTGRLLGFDRPERGMMLSLTVGQAAGALAAVTVARRLDLVEQSVVNATVLVILVTALTASLIGERTAPRVSAPQPRIRGFGQRVIVPVANPHTAGPLVELAGLVAGADHGSVVAVNVLGFGASRQQVEEHRAVTAEAERAALAAGAEAETVVRIDANPSAGVLHTVVEHGGTCILAGWKGFANRRENFFGGIIDTLVGRANVPVLVAHPGADPEIQRVVVSLSHQDLAPAGAPARTLALEVAHRVATQAGVPLRILAQDDPDEVAAVVPEEWGDDRSIVQDERAAAISLREHTGPGDVVVMGVPPVGGRLGQRAARVGRAVRDRTLLVAVPH